MAACPKAPTCLFLSPFPLFGCLRRPRVAAQPLYQQLCCHGDAWPRRGFFWGQTAVKAEGSDLSSVLV